MMPFLFGKCLCTGRCQLILWGVLAALLPVGLSPAQAPVQDDVGVGNAPSVAPHRITPLPATYRVVEHFRSTCYRGGRAAGTANEKTIYANTRGAFLFRPSRGVLVADDLVTTLVAPCALNELRVRVSGGVDEGGGEFRAELSLYDACPDTSVGGQLIPGTRRIFEGLDDDAAVLHDLVLAFRDRGICDNGSACAVSAQDCGDGSTCVPDPLIIPRAVWVRIRFDTNEAGIVTGSPPETGFSVDGYDDQFGNCRTWFGGWPHHPHASHWVTLMAPATCQTNFLAYQTGGHQSCSSEGLPPLEPTSTLGDDITLTVPNCILDSYELGIIGTAGPYEVDMALRWPDLETVIPETQTVFVGRGEGSFEIAHVSIPHDISIEILESDQPIFITWAPASSNVGAICAADALAGSTDKWLFALVDDVWRRLNTTWGYPYIAYTAVYCRGEAPTGACCSRAGEPGVPEEVCVDSVPVTDCLGHEWALGDVCGDDPFNTPCGAHACCLPDGTCENLFESECSFTCDPSFPWFTCNSDEDCPDGRKCIWRFGGSFCFSPCGVWRPDAFCGHPTVECPTACSMDDLVSALFDGGMICPDGSCYPLIGQGPNCAIDARQPHRPSYTPFRFGWDRLVLEFECNPANLAPEFLEFAVRDSAQVAAVKPAVSRVENGHLQIIIELDGPIPPGEWTCVQHVASGREWCAGYLPGDVNQDRLVNTADINALIDSINLVPGRVLPPYATDIDRSNKTTGSDILRLIDLLNGADEFDIWMTRSLPPCPTSP